MSTFARLPPILRLASLIAFVASLATLAALALLLLQLLGHVSVTAPLEPERMTLVVGGLALLGVAYALLIFWYTARFRRSAAQRPLRLATWRSQVGAILLLAVLPLGQLVVALFAPMSFPVLAVGLALGILQLALVVGAIVFFAFLAAYPGRKGVEQQERHDGKGSVINTSSSDQQLPFRLAWWSFDLGRYRPCDGIYCYSPYTSLPLLPDGMGALDWLGPLDPKTDREMAIHRNAPEARGALAAILADATKLGLTLPESFVYLMGSAELRDRIPSCTACFFKLSEHIVPCIGSEQGYVVRFLNDQQDVFLWYLYLTPQGQQRVLISAAPLDELEREYSNGLSDDEREAVIGNTFICALSFDAFIYRWWLENTIWFKLNTSDAGELTEEQQRYLAHYEQPQGSKSQDVQA